jgi:TatD DNase family protein
VETAKVLGETRGAAFEDIARQTTNNFFRLFSKVPRPPQAAGEFVPSAQAQPA